MVSHRGRFFIRAAPVGNGSLEKVLESPVWGIYQKGNKRDNVVPVSGMPPHHVQLKGVPLRVEIGPKDLAKDAVFAARRDTGEKTSVSRTEFVANIGKTLQAMQDGLFQRALAFREQHTRRIDSLDEFKAWFTPKNEEQPEMHGGFALCHFVDDPSIDALLKDLKVTVRCIPLGRVRTSPSSARS